MKKALCFGLVAIGAALGTWTLGWWAVPVVALVAGLAGCGPGITAAASAAAWLILIMVDAAAGSVWRISATLGGVMGLPGPVLLVLTLALPALLGWSAAVLGTAARSLRATSRQPS